jgi:hypothetical protein
MINMKRNTYFLLLVFTSIISFGCKKSVILPNITTLPVTEVFANEAQSGGVISSAGNGQVTARGVVWSISPTPTIALNTKTIDSSGIGTFNSKITGLTPNTKYYVRAYATSSKGTAYGNEVSFSTNDINLKNGLVAYYPFSGNLLDSNSTSIKRDGIAGGAITFTADRFGNPARSVGFTSTKEGFVKTPSSINDLINTFTISCWVNALSSDRVVNEGITGREGYGAQLLLHATHGAAWGVPSQNAGVGLCVSTNQIVVIEHTDGFIAAPLVHNSLINGWHLITLVYINHIPKLYVDGVFVKNGLGTNILNVRPSNGNDYNNGYGGYSTSGFGRGFSPSGTPPIPQFNGSIDEFRIYNRALTQSEITYLATH